jgi:hypothetical protein
MSTNQLNREDAARIFNEVIAKHPQIKIKASPIALVVGGKCVIFSLNPDGEKLAEDFFDSIFPKLKSGIYYHYATLETFKAIVSSGNLRFFSTKKKSSVGEFIPFCQDLDLDGYWRKKKNGKATGLFSKLMDNLFYKSFVKSPNENAEKLWKVFGDKHKGVRLKFKINIHQEYKDFRLIAYQKSSQVPAIKDLKKAFQAKGYHFVPLRVSAMGGFYQLSKHKYQNECRLIAKRIPEYPKAFPFKVNRDKAQACNFIDCDLTKPTCIPFQIELLEVTPGQHCKVQEVDDQVKQNTRIKELKKRK